VTAVARSNYASIQEKGIKITTDEDKFGIIQGYRPHRRTCFLLHSGDFITPFVTTYELTYACPPVVSSIDEAADTTYAYVVITTKSLPDVSPTEELVKPIIKKRLSETFVLIQVSRLLPSPSCPPPSHGSGANVSDWATSTSDGQRTGWASRKGSLLLLGGSMRRS
jgi:hypothetical protein